MSRIELKPFLDAPDFRLALRSIARDFREELGLPVDVDEIGVVCPDIEATAAWLEETYGAGPFLLAESAPWRFTDRGTDTRYQTRAGFGYFEDVLIEIAEAGTGSDIFGTHLDPAGAAIIHHLGYFARGKRHTIDGTHFAERMAAQGYAAPTWTAQVFAGVTGNVALYDTRDKLDDCVLEFLDFRLAGLPIPYPRGANELMARLQKKHGPRVLHVPGPSGEGPKLAWTFHSVRVIAGRSPAQIWPWIAETAKFGEWLGGDVSGSLEVGGQVTIEVDLDGDGHADVMIEETTAMRAPYERQSKSLSSDLFSSSRTVLTLTEDPQGTRVVWQQSFVPEQSFAGLELSESGERWMEQSLDRLTLLAGDGLMAGEIVFRDFGSQDGHAVVKIKGALAEFLYSSLSDPFAQKCRRLTPKRCKRMGRSFIASTMNLVDRYVVELRFDRTGLAELTSEWALSHGSKPPRHHGICTLKGDELRLSGQAATALRAFLGSASSDDVVLEVASLASGDLSLRPV